ncbi:TPA: hypothetical protein ACTUT5_000411 [Legionella anisa]|uniref:hypothetical protein n=1 Tax=Legionella anisa TaxID=28082 RepID=UPI00034680F0|nr:hypothetical protein [Legionella anisa]MBN5934672.1 hypothetical protein [Legionella anisa]MCW8423653.1 hypothetical protein [Legionella anisa]MCW8447173.1 hypothetical protein [Legionella anisa]
MNFRCQEVRLLRHANFFGFFKLDSLLQSRIGASSDCNGEEISGFAHERPEHSEHWPVI